MGARGARRAVAAGLLSVLVTAGVASAEEAERGIDPNQGRSLVEVSLPSKGAAMRLQLASGLATTSSSTSTTCAATATARSPSPSSGPPGRSTQLQDAGYDVGSRRSKGPDTWRERMAGHARPRSAGKQRAAAAARERRRRHAAPTRTRSSILRADYFENYAGRFLSVEAKTRQGSAAPDGSSYIGPTLSVSWNRGRRHTGRRPPDVGEPEGHYAVTYIEYRQLIRIGETGNDPAGPADVHRRCLRTRRPRTGALERLAAQALEGEQEFADLQRFTAPPTWTRQRRSPG